MIVLPTYISLLLVPYCLWRLSRRINRSPLPPGPPGLPLFRNLFDWPTSKEWETLGQWAITYGDVVHAEVLGTHMVVLNGFQAASDLMNAKGAIYCDRPSQYFIDNIIGWRDSMIILEDGDEYREQRRLFAQAIGTKAALDRFNSIQETHVCWFVNSILKEPGLLLQYTRAMAGAIILETTYGYQINGTHDKLIHIAERAMNDFSEAAVPGAYLVNIFPWMDKFPAWFPGMKFKRIGAEYRERWMEFVEWPFQYAKNHVFEGDAHPSFVSFNLRDNFSPERERTLKWCASSMYAGGTHTSVSVVYAFFCLMVMHPDVQAKAKAEIDEVIGFDRLPVLSDQSQLPYVKAVISEVLRYGQVAPQGLPHRLRANDVYKGYFIPKGSIVFPNIRFISRDARYYTNPDVFNPDRFLGSNPELDPRAYIFGFGRRICPGRLFGEATIFLAVSNVLSTLDVIKAVDASGQEIIPELEYSEGVVTVPKQFPCNVRSRSPRAEELLKESISN